jgi:hypothetical protein
MKRLAGRRFRAARAAGLVGAGPRPRSLRPASAEAEAARRGYRLGWFVLPTEPLGACSRTVYVFGAVSTLPPACDAPGGAVPPCYDVAQRLTAAVGAVTTFTYDGSGVFTWLVGDGPAAGGPKVTAWTCSGDGLTGPGDSDIPVHDGTREQRDRGPSEGRAVPAPGRACTPQGCSERAGPTAACWGRRIVLPDPTAFADHARKEEGERWTTS